MSRVYQMCSRCVMDTTDPEIEFDEDGVCNHCHYFDRQVRPNWFPNREGWLYLERITEKIKRHGSGRDYDCLIGLSGGVDSCYLACKVREFGLRPLVVHVDAGWDYEVAVQNIEKVVDYCGYDLYTHVMNWEDMKRLQLAYLRSGIANQDVPQDHAFSASLYHFAVRHKIKYVLSGGNFATEAIFPQAWHYTAMDGKNLRAIFKRFGDGKKLKEFKIMNLWEYYFYYPYVKKMKVIRPLNYMPYIRNKAIKELEEKTGWRAYGRKHGESVFTRFFQNYYLVERFGYDKRKPHLASMILSGQMTRRKALEELSKPLYHDRELEEDKIYVRKKLGLSKEEFQQLLEAPARQATEFPSSVRFHRNVKYVQAVIEKLLGRRIANYT